MTTSPYGLQPVRTRSAHELVLQQIETAINLGRFRPGDRLPTERDLADMLHVSRTTVREAIAVLENRGVIEVRRGRNGGAIVLDVVRTKADLRKLLRANRDQLRDTFDFRVAVESAAARLAAERRTAADIDTLRRLVDMLSLVVESPAEVSGSARFAQFQNLDSQFHLAIAHAAGSQRLATAILESRSAMFLPVGAVFTDLEPTANDLHEAVVEAIVAADGDEAARVMAEHINVTRSTVEGWL
ncbi:FadR/GntR family transcriptional regulator [Longivirga aurantiaca]|uniref:FadR/GntR family transcriptional regulator n=1 Tax=Longivirga aurantiaca TaxID=1837743 RepID=A0ABW1SVW2_9ACTN